MLKAEFDDIGKSIMLQYGGLHFNQQKIKCRSSGIDGKFAFI